MARLAFLEARMCSVAELRSRGRRRMAERRSGEELEGDAGSGGWSCGMNTRRRHLRGTFCGRRFGETRRQCRESVRGLRSGGRIRNVWMWCKVGERRKGK